MVRDGLLVFVKSLSANDTKIVRTNTNHRYHSLTPLSLVLIILIGCGILFSSCVPVIEYSATIIVENNTPTEVTILYNEDIIDGNGQKSSTLRLGPVPAGETKTVYGPFLGGITAVPRVYLKARDPSYRIIWENSWTGKEFGKLSDPRTGEGLKIVLNP